MFCFCQLSNRLGNAKCSADLAPPSAVARSSEQAITIEGKDTDYILTPGAGAKHGFHAGLKT